MGSVPPNATMKGGLGLGGLGLASILTGTHPYALGAGALAAGYGTKTGQKVARGLQRALTAEEVAIMVNALRRGVTPALAGGKDD